MAHKKWDYSGVKKITSIRLSEEEKKLILDKFNSVQEFIQFSLDLIKAKKRFKK